MPEEIMKSQVDQGAAGPDASGDNGYFDAYTLVDDSGNTIASEKDPAGEVKEKPNTNVPNPPTPNGENPDPSVPADKKEQKPSATRTAFEKRFFKEQNGVDSFDTDKFAEFLQKRKAPEMQAPAMPQQPDGKQAPAEPAKPPENPYLERVKARREYRENLMAPAQIFNSAYQEARKAGYDENRAMGYAQQQWAAKVEEQAAIYEAEQEEEWANKQGASERARQEAVQARTTRMQNELVYAKEFGTVDDFREFVLGRVENGKLVGGYANDLLWANFQRDNPDVQRPTEEQFSSWYDKFGSRHENIHMLYEVAWSRMVSRQWENVVKRIQGGQQQMQAQQQVSRTSKPGARQNSPVGGANGSDPLDGFMMPNINTI